MDLNPIDYEIGKRLSALDLPITALISAAMRKADTNNMAKLSVAFPQVAKDLQARYNAPGGILEKDSFKVSADGAYERVQEVAEGYFPLDMIK